MNASNLDTSSQNLARRTAARRSQRGVSFVQLAFIIGIASLLVVAAIIYGPRYFTKAKVQNEVSALTDFRAATVSFGSRVGLFTSTNSSLEALIGQNFFPMTMVSGTAPNRVVTNQWGGSYTVAVGTIVNAGDAIVLTSTGIPATACTELGTSLDGIASVITVNGTTVKTNGNAANPVTVAANCGGTNGDNNAMAITMPK
jgi:hypothetical protein